VPRSRRVPQTSPSRREGRSRPRKRRNRTMSRIVRLDFRGARALLIFASAAVALAAVVTPAPAASSCDEWMTAGGYITLVVATPGDAAFVNTNGNFGASGGIRNGRLWGSLNYIDHV